MGSGLATSDVPHRRTAPVPPHEGDRRAPRVPVPRPRPPPCGTGGRHVRGGGAAPPRRFRRPGPALGGDRAGRRRWRHARWAATVPAGLPTRHRSDTACGGGATRRGGGGGGSHRRRAAPGRHRAHPRRADRVAGRGGPLDGRSVPAPRPVAAGGPGPVAVAGRVDRPGPRSGPRRLVAAALRRPAGQGSAGRRVDARRVGHGRVERVRGATSALGCVALPGRRPAHSGRAGAVGHVAVRAGWPGGPAGRTTAGVRDVARRGRRGGCGGRRGVGGAGGCGLAPVGAPRGGAAAGIGSAPGSRPLAGSDERAVGPGGGAAPGAARAAARR
ncbi:hypothetical protein ONO86_02722 [Micromonospora noduli]|nr:hypothetical protein ONO86_02722 [Micromonospora noduli]